VFAAAATTGGVDVLGRRVKVFFCSARSVQCVGVWWCGSVVWQAVAGAAGSSSGRRGVRCVRVVAGSVRVRVRVCAKSV